MYIPACTHWQSARYSLSRLREKVLELLSPCSSVKEARAERKGLCPPVCWWERTRRSRRAWSRRGEGLTLLPVPALLPPLLREGDTNHHSPAGRRRRWGGGGGGGGGGGENHCVHKLIPPDKQTCTEDSMLQPC